ncbi:MAG: hypothetical protein ACLQIB_36130 [Isosphaeraceae bacterium]
MNPNWQEQARRELAGIKSAPSGWSYGRIGAPCVEPTVLACLALLGAGDEESRDDDLAHSRTAALWLVAIQRTEGRLPVSQALEGPGWTTPFAILLWSTLAVHHSERARAVRWLLAMAGNTRERDAQVRRIVGHNLTLAGWPWVEGTHSWVEPTALSILALGRAGLGNHPRVASGTRMILDRALPHGGWNCGNKTVFGRELRPQPVPTAVSLLALAAQGVRSQAVSRAVDYLRRTVSGLRAPVSLGWSVLALRAHQAMPPDADAALERAFAESTGSIDPVRSLALLLLASREESASILTSSASSRSESHPTTREIQREPSS